MAIVTPTKSFDVLHLQYVISTGVNEWGRYPIGKFDRKEIDLK